VALSGHVTDLDECPPSGVKQISLPEHEMSVLT